ncbi:MAG TPA: hypothetical protein DEO84_10630 [candidate division Zixibacteria bacterium]|nr:hypothetical protein [candidate division Zixibacteria bacterium]
MAKLKTYLFSLLGLGFLLRAIVAIRPLKFIDGLTIPDDSYLSLTLARNIAKGLGPLYGDAYTNGFQPLYVLLISPVYHYFAHDLITPVHLALLFSAAVDTATLYIIYRLVKDISQAEITPFIAVFAWAINPYVISTANNGLDTTLSLFFITLSYFFYTKFIKPNFEKTRLLIWFVFGVLLGLTMLARIDNAILVAAFILAVLYSDYNVGSDLRRSAGHLTMIGTGALFAVLPWIIYIYQYTGDLIPVSGRAIRYLSLSWCDHYPTLTNMYIPMIKLGAGSVINQNLTYIILLILLVLTILLTKGKNRFDELFERLKAHNIVLSFVCLLFFSYTLYIFGIWYSKRYFFPSAFLFLLYIATLFDIIYMLLESRRLKNIFTSCVLLFLMAAAGLSPSFRALYFSINTNEQGYMNFGLWAKDTFPDSTVIGSCQTGALAYFAQNLKVVNLDGVVNKPCYERLIRREAIDYMKDKRIAYFIDWTNNLEFIQRESRDLTPDDLEPLGKIDQFKSWNHDWHVFKVKLAK